jgi:hypothetical protein
MLSMHLTGAMSAGGPRGALPLSPELQQCAIGEGRLLLRSRSTSLGAAAASEQRQKPSRRRRPVLLPDREAEADAELQRICPFWDVRLLPNAHYAGVVAVRSGGFSGRFLRRKRDRTVVAPERGSRRADVGRPSLSTVGGEVSEASWNARGGYRSKCPASCVRWSSLRPPNVVLGRDPAAVQDLGGLHAAMPGEGQQHVEDLRGLQTRRRVEQQRTDRHSAGLEVALELRAEHTNLVRPP